MTQQLVRGTPAGPLAEFADRLPRMIASADDRTAWRFVDFFAVTIRNPNTREAYYRAVSRFMGWCEQYGLHRLGAIRPIHVAAYVEQLPLSRPLGQAAPLGHQQVLRLDGLRRNTRDQPGDVGPEAEGTSSGSARLPSSVTTRPGPCSSRSQ